MSDHTYFKTKIMLELFVIRLQCIVAMARQFNYYLHYSSDNLTNDSVQFTINLLIKWAPAKPIVEYNVYIAIILLQLFLCFKQFTL